MGELMQRASRVEMAISGIKVSKIARAAKSRMKQNTAESPYRISVELIKMVL